MKFIHLSDLHIGKRLNGFSFIEDQRYILSRTADIAAEQKADGIIIAGDVYDRNVPSSEAVELLDEFLTKLCNMNIPVYIISGNHDSAERLSFGCDIMSRAGIYISKTYNGSLDKITAEDRYGRVNIYLMPFVKPASVRCFFPDDDTDSCDSAIRTVLAHTEIDRRERNLLVCHQFITGAQVSGDEEINVGTLDNIDVSAFDKFDYVALGHIHRPQYISRETVRYCGTPLKYSLSESPQNKSVTVAELCEKGSVKISTIPLKPLRELRKIRGTYAELTARESYAGTDTDDYIYAVLTDENDIPNVQDKLREIYPNLMNVEYDNTRTRKIMDIHADEHSHERSPLELFSQLYYLQNNAELSDVQRDFMSSLIEKIWEDKQ